MKRKVTVTTGTRADYGILRPVLRAISESKKLQLYLIVTGTHISRKHGFTIEEIKRDGFKIYSKISMIPKGDTSYDMSKTLGEGIMKFSKIFKKLKPDINIILGDRDEMLASAIAAYHMNIPNAHIHGGDKSGGIDEYTRHAITKISNIHFVATKKSMDRVLRMGENPKHVIHTGSPSIDEVRTNQITNKEALENKYNIKFTGSEILLLQHSVTTDIKQSHKEIKNILEAILKIGKNTIAILPNSDAGSKKIFQYLKSYSKNYSFIKVFSSLPRNDYLGILKNCGVLVGNSSSGMIEASYFDVPVVNIGIRQLGRETGKNVINIKNGTARSIHSAILSSIKKKHNRNLTTRKIYGVGNSSYKIVKYLERMPLNKMLIQKQITY